MHRRTLLVLASVTLLGVSLSGCFGSNAEADIIDGSKLPKFQATLFLNQIMFHPAPGVMLSAWMFTEDQNKGTFDIPVFEVVEGQTVEITLINTHEMNHTIHWHGLHVPWEMDGVPYVTQDPVGFQESFTYTFTAKPAGTHFFHCHVDTPHHMDMGMYGVLIVHPADHREPIEYDSEALMVLDDWDSRHLHQQGNADVQMTADSMVDPSGDPFNQADRTVGQIRDTYNDPSGYAGVGEAYDAAGGHPARATRDWYPETHAPWQPDYDTYTINGKAFPWTDPIHIEEGENKKIRLINVGNSIFSIHLHGHRFMVTHTDGYALTEPYGKDTLLIGPGERYDIVIEGNNPGPAWHFHDHMGLHAMNSHIYPGGAMTMLCYEAFPECVDGGGGHQHHARTAGDFLGLYK